MWSGHGRVIEFKVIVVVMHIVSMFKCGSRAGLESLERGIRRGVELLRRGRVLQRGVVPQRRGVGTLKRGGEGVGYPREQTAERRNRTLVQQEQRLSTELQRD